MPLFIQLLPVRQGSFNAVCTVNTSPVKEISNKLWYFSATAFICRMPKPWSADLGFCVAG